MGFTVLNITEAPYNETFNAQNDAPCSTSECATAPSVSNITLSSESNAPKNTEHKPKEKDFPFASNSMQAQVMRVADLYESQINYPKYSYSIAKGNLGQFIPNQHIATSLPLMGSGLGDDASLQLSLDKFHYFWGETLIPTVTIILDGSGTEIDQATFTLVTADGKTVLSSNESRISRNQATADISLSSTSSTDEQDYFLVAEVRTSGSGEHYEVRTSLKVGNMVGEITGISNSHLDGSHLVIPVNLTLEDGGYYLISANLYTDNNEPLLNLSYKGKLSKLDDNVLLRAHFSALSISNNEGPYKLGNFDLKKLPSGPGDPTEYGKVPKKEFSVQGFPFNDYDQTPYSNPQAEARVEFLKTLSNSQG